jgi:hypothetical protein
VRRAVRPFVVALTALAAGLLGCDRSPTGVADPPGRSALVDSASSPVAARIDADRRSNYAVAW